MKIQTRTVLSRLLLPLIATASLLSATSVYSAIMTVEMTGRISGKSFPSATSVQVGDTFGLTFNYDYSLQTSGLYYANGRRYTTTDQPFPTEFSGWWGTLPQDGHNRTRPLKRDMSGGIFGGINEKAVLQV